MAKKLWAHSEARVPHTLLIVGQSLVTGILAISPFISLPCSLELGHDEATGIILPPYAKPTDMYYHLIGQWIGQEGAFLKVINQTMMDPAPESVGQGRKALLIEVAVAAATAIAACAGIEGLRLIVANPDRYQLNPAMTIAAPPLPLTLHNHGAPTGVQKRVTFGNYTVTEVNDGKVSSQKLTLETRHMEDATNYMKQVFRPAEIEMLTPNLGGMQQEVVVLCWTYKSC